MPPDGGGITVCEFATFTIGGRSDTNMSHVTSQPQVVNMDLRDSNITEVGRDVHYHLLTIRFVQPIIVVYKCDADNR